MTLTRSTPLRRTPIRRRSARKEQEMAERRKLLEQIVVVEGRDRCEIVPWLHLAWHSMRDGGFTTLWVGTRDCRGVVEGLHERRKRSSQGSLTNRQNLIPSCNACNRWVEENPLLARRIGLVVRPGDPEWEELAA